MKTFTTTDGKTIERVSRWIKIQTIYNITPRHSLYCYAEDMSDDGNGVDYFTYKGTKYALNQFISCLSPWGYPIMWYENDKLQHASGYDSENYYNPLILEFSDCCEYIRLYQEVL
jgi:hypothetical protein